MTKSKALKNNSDVSEDEIKKGEDDVQKKTDAVVKQVDVIVAAKEKEVLSI
ncbi:ribosome recycling factor [Clostridium saccharobutylicum]|nr:ribosome recycling factor [Clostridium saccharobutylicum]